MSKIEDVSAPIGAGCRSTELGEHDRIPTAAKRILVPTDLTNESERAIEFGFVLAKLFGAHLTLLHVYKEPYAVQYLRGPYACDAVLQERMHFESTLNSIAEEVRKRYADCNTEFRAGEPCEEIVKLASERGIDLIVISTHHNNWLTRLAYGCDAEQILSNLEEEIES
jgi:nucleotide-binding universal stress UspA family protein